MSKIVSFLRLRPAGEINQLWAATRRREGTTTAESSAVTSESRIAALAGGLAPVSVGLATGAEPMAWVVTPENALTLHRRGVPGWRITVLDNGVASTVLDAVARTGAAFIRTGRSDVAPNALLANLPGLDTSVSVFVDSVADAADAVRAGACDLLLRGWDTESLGALREALVDSNLQERTALPIGVEIDAVRNDLDKELFTAYLGQVDGSGVARPRYEWAPGMDTPAPIPAGRISAEWADQAWLEGTPTPVRSRPRSELRSILDRSLEGTPPTRAEIEVLFRARGDEVDAIAEAADELRERACGETVTYVVNRNINYTNLCFFKCGFCAFSKGPRSLNLRGDPYLMTVPQVVERSVEAWERGATEVCLQGGIHPDFTGDFYVTVVESIKEYVPDMHIHGFTPLEVWQGAETLGIEVKDFLRRLKDAGLGTLPGTAAEILDDAVRVHLCPDKIRTSQWAQVMVTAHEMGLRTTSTVMFGHIDSPTAWANHYEVLRSIQRRTGGITEFVPLPFVHMGAPIFLRGQSRQGPTWDEVVLVHAVARIAFDGLIPNIQASWVKLGLDAGARLLQAGCNDMGGTLMDETISRAAGAAHGTEMSPSDFEAAITSIGRVPARRTTLYEVVEMAPEV
jgi:FO synthase